MSYVERYRRDTILQYHASLEDGLYCDAVTLRFWGPRLPSICAMLAFWAYPRVVEVRYSSSSEYQDDEELCEMTM